MDSPAVIAGPQAHLLKRRTGVASCDGNRKLVKLPDKDTVAPITGTIFAKAPMMETWMFEAGGPLPAPWEAAFGRIPTALQDVYYHPGYGASWLGWEGGRAVALWEQIEGIEYLYCVLLKELPYRVDSHWRYDAQSFYGYGGIISSAPPVLEHLEHFNDQLDQWMQHHGVVVEFIRQHPLLHPQPMLARRADDYAAVRTNVYADGPGIVRRQLESARRRNIAKAIASGLCVERWDAHRGAAMFAALYHRSALRLNMDAFYHFPEQYFHDVASYLGQRAWYLVALLEQRPIAALLVLAGGQTLTYHLGASDERFWQLRPNDLLFATLLDEAAATGYRWVSLGGGTTNDPSDSLYRYKATFGNVHLPVFVGKRVHDRRAYEHLCALWERDNPERAEQGRRYVLRYRLGEFDRKVAVP